MSDKYYSKPNSGAGLWLSLAAVPLLFLILFAGAMIVRNLDPDAEDTSVQYEEFNERDADYWLQKFGLEDLDMSDGPVNLTGESEDYSVFADEESSEDQRPYQDDESASKKDESASKDDDSQGADSEDDAIQKDDTKDDEPAKEEDTSIEALMAEMEEGGYYYYSTLNDDEKRCYAEIYDIYSNVKDMTKVSAANGDMLRKLDYIVLGDHPELFYIRNMVWMDKKDGIYVSADYNYSRSEIASRKILNENAVQRILDSEPGGLSEFDEVKYFYDYIVENTVYNLGSKDNQEYSSVFLNHESVCAGYARAMQYLLQKRGIQAMYVTDTKEPGLHAWIVLRVDGEYYHLDVTWADPLDEGVPRPDYSFFCVPTAIITRDSEHSHDIDWDIYPIPECNSMNSNFYVVNDFYVDDIDDAHIQDIFDRSVFECNGAVSMMASDEGMYKALRSYLFDEGMVYEFFGPNQLWTLDNEDMLTLTIYK